MAKKKKNPPSTSHVGDVVDKIYSGVGVLRARSQAFLGRRPHRSFRRTPRRDYVRSLAMPGYWSFTGEVRRILWSNRKTFALMTLVYATITAVMVGVASQDLYSTLVGTLRETSGEIFKGNMGELGKAGLLFATIATGGLTQALTEAQQIYAGLIGLLTWLTVVWLLRNILAGHKVKLRDGLYNASAPLLSTFIVALVLLVQLIPLALAFLGYSAASTSGLLSGGVEAMLFWVVAGLLSVLSLYWATSSLLALVVVTLPGMYPLRALKTAGDLVIGRRVRILFRFLWMMGIVLVVWIAIMLPFILIDTWLKSLWPALEWLPLVPFVLLALSSLTVVWTGSYTYLLYRKVVADDADPA